MRIRNSANLGDTCTAEGVILNIGSWDEECEARIVSGIPLEHLGMKAGIDSKAMAL